MAGGVSTRSVCLTAFLCAGSPRHERRQSAAFRGEAMRGEFYMLQLGVHAPLANVRILPSWTALEGPGGAPGLAQWRVRCINTPNGTAKAENGIPLAKGGVQPLWFGVDVPPDAVPGEYSGHIHIAELHEYRLGEERLHRAGFVERVAVKITVRAESAEQRGDSELWRHSRLRWLDSDVGTGAVTAAAASHGAHRGRSDVWQPIRLDEGRLTLTASGQRVVRLSRRGLPASLAVGSVELLASPMQVRLYGEAGRELRWAPRRAPASADPGRRRGLGRGRHPRRGRRGGAIGGASRMRWARD